MDRYSVRLYGLGGQGLKSMIQDMLAPLLLRAGFQVQAFPFFGGERRGSAVAGYLRFGQKKITTHSFIDEPDMVVVFDHRRISVKNALAGLAPGGVVLINTSVPKQFFGLMPDWRVFTVDARAISLANGIGDSADPFLVINTAMTGALIGALEQATGKHFPTDAAEKVLRDVLSQKISENLAALHEGKRTVAKLLPDGSPMWQLVSGTRSIPRLGQPDERCTKCNLCYLFCPKRAIDVAENGAYVIQDEKCNYCGICAAVCPRDAIGIITEEGGA